MGLFFEDKKPDLPAPVVQEVKQDWLAVLIGGAFALLGMLLLAALRALAFVARPVFQHLFTFEGRTREQILMQMGIALAIVGVPLFFLYQMPAVRDAVSLSSTHTINHSDGYRPDFPDRSFFVLYERRLISTFAGKTYYTYSGYTDGTMQNMLRGECQMVPRAGRMGMSSLLPPIQAAGFEDQVTYPVSQKVSDLRGWHFFKQVVLKPDRWSKSKMELSSLAYGHDTTSSWKEFVENWDTIVSPPGFDGSKPFEVKALAREHAVICF